MVWAEETAKAKALGHGSTWKIKSGSVKLELSEVGSGEAGPCKWSEMLRFYFKGMGSLGRFHGKEETAMFGLLIIYIFLKALWMQGSGRVGRRLG